MPQRKKLVHLPLPFVCSSLIKFTFQLDWATSLADVVKRFTDISAVEQLNQNNTHCAQNTFTVSPEFHGPFGRLRISLQPIGHVRELVFFPFLLNARSI